MEAAFAPRVEATCKAGFMIIQVNFNMTKFKGKTLFIYNLISALSRVMPTYD